MDTMHDTFLAVRIEEIENFPEQDSFASGATEQLPEIGGQSCNRVTKILRAYIQFFL